jgi:DNA-binding transcriptional ArsR family regulator
MLRYHFGDQDLLRTRFAISPLFELTQSVTALRDPATKSIHLPWVRDTAPRIADLDLAPLQALVPAGTYQPDFISPPPTTPDPDIETEFERVRSTAPDELRRDLEFAFPEGVPAPLRPLLENLRAALDALVDLIVEYWERSLAPHWDAIRQTLEDDIAYRARKLTAAGPVEVFDDLHRDVRWRERLLEVDRPYEEDVDLAGRGLMLVPSAFAWPDVKMLSAPPWQPALNYPARGVGSLWAPAGQDPAALADLLGDRRAAILRALEREASTTAVARRLHASPAGVSAHLSVLRRAGLLRARRHGREVLYKRTPAGDALLRAAP